MRKTRLIDANKLRKDILGLADCYNGFSDTYDKAQIVDMIDEQPTVDPVKHGRWIEENRRPKSSLFYCSECHRTAYDIQPTRAEGWVKRCRYAYCPNCGAYMLDKEDK